MKITIPIIGDRQGQPIIDDFFDNICNVVGINTDIIIGCPGHDQEDNARQFILVKDKVIIQKKYENTPKEILDIYPNRPNKKLVYFFEVQIDDDKLVLLTGQLLPPKGGSLQLGRIERNNGLLIMSQNIVMTKEESFDQISGTKQLGIDDAW